MPVIEKARAQPSGEIVRLRHEGRHQASRTLSNFYLVGETQRPTPRPPTANGRTIIVINGRYQTMRGRSASFRQLLRLAYPYKALHSPDMATISFHGGAGSRPCGFLVPGDVIELISTLTINADATLAS